MSQEKKGKLSLLKGVIKIFVIGFVGMTSLGWIEAKIRGKQSSDTNEYLYHMVELLADKASINKQNDQGESPLHLAIKTKNQQLVEILVQRGANISTTTKIRATPLHYAASFANEEIIKLLISKGANVNATDNNNEEPVDWAVRTKQKGNAELLKSITPANITQHYPR